MREKSLYINMVNGDEYYLDDEEAVVADERLGKAFTNEIGNPFANQTIKIHNSEVRFFLKHIVSIERKGDWE